MKITIELSTGKKIELTQAEFNELFNRVPIYQPYYYPSWPVYTTSGTSTDGMFKLYHDSTAANTGPSFSIGDNVTFTNDDGTVD